MKKIVKYIFLISLLFILFITNVKAESVTFDIKSQRKGFWCGSFDLKYSLSIDEQEKIMVSWNSREHQD